MFSRGLPKRAPLQSLSRIPFMGDEKLATRAARERLKSMSAQEEEQVAGRNGSSRIASSTTADWAQHSNDRHSRLASWAISLCC